MNIENVDVVRTVVAHDSIHHHIDNGGITVHLSLDNFNQVNIEMNTQYFGYPSITTNLNGYLDHETIEKIGLLFLKFAAKMKV